MRNVLQHWQELPREDLFSFWRSEVQLKKDLRKNLSGCRDFKIQSESQYVFLRQSLAYGEYKPIFMQILFFNMDSLAVQNELLHGPWQLCEDFLRSLPQIIKLEKPLPHSLQFLINLYRDECKDCYENILAVLGYEECDYLLERTANNDLRKMLRSRCTQLHQQQSEIHHGLLHSTAGNHATIFGDKLDLLKQTIRILSFTPETKPENLFIYLSRYLEAAEQLFMLGMLNESLALLQIVYRQWTAGRESFLPEDYNSMNKSISRILSKSLSMNALLNSCFPYQFCQNLLQQNFPELRPENLAQTYLQIYQNIHINNEGNMNYTFIEMTHSFLQLSQGEDDILAAYFINGAELDENKLHKLLAEIDRDLTVMPHKALTAMEILRFLAYSHKIHMSKPLAGRLLQNYLALYKWIPAAPFLNRSILDQLGKATDYNLQNEAEKRWSTARQYTRHSIQDLYLRHPDRFKGENNIVLQQLLLGSFFGGE
jgi:hypothetical protein